MTTPTASRTVFPSEEEARALVLGPDSVVWRNFSDIRLYAGAGYALLLQVAHPTVGSGVRDHSEFRSDPFGRLLRTMDYLNLIVYGGPQAIEVGRRLREMHKPIRGRNADGSRYSALEPEAYAWVHATLFESAMRTRERFVGPLTERERDRFYAEFMPLGRLLGIRAGDIPPDRPAFRDYFDTMVNERLERTDSVDDVLAALAEPTQAPPLPGPIRRAWPLLRVPPAKAVGLATRWLLDPALRQRLGIGWTNQEERESRVLAALSRACGPVLPGRLKTMGPAYLEWRRQEIEAGALGG